MRMILGITTILILGLLMAACSGQPLAPTTSVAMSLSDDAPAGQTENEIALLWEGDPLPDDGQEECRTLQVTAAGQAALGPCDAAGAAVELSTAQPGGWAEIVTRFAPFEAETEQGRLVFQGQGDIGGPAWERALATWARLTYNQLAGGRVSASGPTVLSWWLGELPDRPGICRQLVVLNYGYAYHNLTPCEGGQVQESTGGWLETTEWAQFDDWLYQRAPVYQGNDYFSGLGSTEMSQAEITALAGWAELVYTRLSPTR